MDILLACLCARAHVLLLSSAKCRVIDRLVVDRFSLRHMVRCLYLDHPAESIEQVIPKDRLLLLVMIS